MPSRQVFPFLFYSPFLGVSSFTHASDITFLSLADKRKYQFLCFYPISPRVSLLPPEDDSPLTSFKNTIMPPLLSELWIDSPPRELLKPLFICCLLPSLRRIPSHLETQANKNLILFR